jgi:hypothetical protein
MSSQEDISSIIIMQKENFDKLFLIKNYDSIKNIDIFGHRQYNNKIIQQIIKFKKIEQLNITTYDYDLKYCDLNEFANFQSLISLPLALDNSWNSYASDFYISQNKENVIIIDSSKFQIEKLLPMLNHNILNITIFAGKNCEKICNCLPTSCANVRIIIESSISLGKLFKKYKNIKLTNLPTTIRKIDIVFKQIHCVKFVKSYVHDLKIQFAIKSNFKENIKLSFDCELDIIFI